MTLLPRLLLACLLVLFPLAALASSEQDVEQLIAQGQQALATGQAEQAALIFERVVMDQPWRLGVWMDYALALQLSGDEESAQAIYRRLLTENPPEYLRLWLKKQVQGGAAVTANWVAAGSVTMLAGWDSNLNRAPTADSLTLTYPFGPYALPLASSARANGGAAGLLDLNWEAAHRTASGGDWSLQAGLDARDAPGFHSQDYLQASLGVTRRWSHAAGGEILAAAGFQKLQYSGQDMQAMRAGLYLAQPWRAAPSNCSMLYGAEWKLQTYPELGTLNGQYYGVATSFGCMGGLGWNLLVHAGVDRPETQRPGGRQQQVDLRGQVNGQLRSGQWLAEAELSHLRDAEGYSPLLGNNDVRYILRGSVKLEYSHPLGKHRQGVVRIETYRQNSNLPLFEMSGKALWMGMRYGF